MGSLNFKSKPKLNYSKFNQINGKHPLQKSCKDAFITYQARRRHGGKLAFFNFDLAKEMGLIPMSHPEEVTPELEEKILETFSIVIINEYDIENEIEFPEEDILPNRYMATRYLQLQHPNKQGKTSGDGRSVWNGVVKNKGKVWDISSQGTGATSLSPATHIQNKFFQTGDPTISYGCGYSEFDEGLATLMFSEVMNKNNYETERCLAIIKFEDNISINVRANQNLIRPSHMFNHLKQSNYDALKDIVNYYIDRQETNGTWKNVPKTESRRYKYFLKKQTEVFARLAANFEDDYIFCWLDWDGDNILMNGGIIDYGSIRQFGLFHHEYRFDDVQRFSTTIKEQKDKAKYIVQTFIQIVDYLENKEKRPISDFYQSTFLRNFDNLFDEQKKINLLSKVGIAPKYHEFLIKKYNYIIESFSKDFSYFERTKSTYGLYEVSDGVCWDAIFCMRDILRELPQIILSRGETIGRQEFVDIAKSTYATQEDLAINSYRGAKIDSFQKNYMSLIKTIARKENKDEKDILLEVLMRSSIINKFDRVTGDSIARIVESIVQKQKKFDPNTMFSAMVDFREHQTFDPDNIVPKQERNSNTKKELKPIVTEFLQIVRDYREGI
ncbi:hypothetical protein BALOs_2251 [Halobacteriovorax sp. BALOs_7]|uniref:hypothetical protein n=1 Tax=Halobacteriovorax sp. BALOs_7 TaxID=2109558 RepID=UPI000EA24D05|nr:hypothetical protein [Halobacteriovorax sp. BALOs_7]AYF45249.1 hypothetical protein BALOs_2251 [Halobacteriovorax sp. BALOs_7]